MTLRSCTSPPILIALLVLGLLLALEIASRKIPRFDFLQRIEWITYDWRMRLASRAVNSGGASSTNLAFVRITDDTVDIFSHGDLAKELQFGLYWPRHIYGRLVQELTAEGAKAIGLDVLFAELRPDHLPLKTANQTEIESDEYFAYAIAKSGNVILGAAPEVPPHEKFRSRALSMGHISTARDPDGVLRRANAFRDHRLWHEKIREQMRLSTKAHMVSNQLVFISSQATNTLTLTEDGLFNPYDLTGGKPPGGFVSLQRSYEDVRVWHLGIVLAAVQLGLDLTKADINPSRGTIILPSTNGLYRVLPVDRDGRFLIDWTMQLDDPRLTRKAFETVINNPILRQLGSNVPPIFKDKLVVVGSTAVGHELSDRGPTPLATDTYLTSTYWNVASSVISGRFVRTLPFWVNLILIAILAMAGSILTCALSPQRAALSAALLALIYAAGATAAFVVARHWVPMVMPLIALALSYAALVTYQALFEGREKRRVRKVFARVVSPSVVEELLKAPDLALVGKRRCVTVMFADIRGFTEMTDKSQERAERIVEQEHIQGDEAQKVFDSESEEVLGTVNQYLSAIAGTIKKNDGTLDKYIGDCVMAFWGAPTDNERHAAACVQSAIEAQRAIQRLNEARRQENARRERAHFERTALGQTPQPLRLLDVLSVGIGINTGTVDAGLMGSQDAGNYTIFGRDVNVASRLEKLAEGNRILIGETTFRELTKHSPSLGAICVELPPAAVRGIREAVKIYEVNWDQ